MTTRMILCCIALTLFTTNTAQATLSPIENRIYQERGVGGGGAMSSFSISPYNSLWFVGTDMGTLFRSYDEGLHWQAIDHFETTYSSTLANLSYIGFNPDGQTCFYAADGKHPQRSTDTGISWSGLDGLQLNGDERIRYWLSNSQDGMQVFCATTERLLRSTDRGISWVECAGVDSESRGTFIDESTGNIYHATENAVLLSSDQGATFAPYHTPSFLPIRSFSGGRDAVNGLTLAYIDGNDENIWDDIFDTYPPSPEEHQATIAASGWVMVERNSGGFQNSGQYGGDHLRMAENDAATLYVTGADAWYRQYGTKVWVSNDTGQSWQLRFHQYNWDVTPFEPWPADKLEQSGIGLDVGWDDDGYVSFAVDRRNSAVAGGTGWYFLHVTTDTAQHWLSPFTEFADSGDRTAGKKWRSVGLEVTSLRNIQFHPGNPQIGYATCMDIGCLTTDDGGQSFRISRAGWSLRHAYDFDFDPDDDQIVYGAWSVWHDWPFMWYSNVIYGAGGIFRSSDRGCNWERLTPDDGTFDRSFLAVVYDAENRILYGGSHGNGVARSLDNGATWAFFNDGLPQGAGTQGEGRIVPQIEIDPDNGNIYILLAGDDPEFTNREGTGVYFLDNENNATEWVLLRGTVHRPAEVDPQYEMWWYPTGFAIDFDNTNTIWLTDFEKLGSWLATGVWKTTDRGANWYRKLQYTHPTAVVLDPADPDRVHISGAYTVDGGWGQGGAYHSDDGGETWFINDDLPLRANLYGTSFDPNDSNNIFYTFFGGGMMYGPNPIPGNITSVTGEALPVVSLTLTGSPNPFNGRIVFQIGGLKPGGGELSIFDIRGRRVDTRLLPQQGGPIALSWDGKNAEGSAVASGIYFAVVTNQGQRQTRKITYVK